MKLYFPESKDQTDVVGYNNLIRMFRKVLGEFIVDDPAKADFRVYCNLPWHPHPKDLKKEGLPLLVYTMYESTKLPKSRIKFLNEHADVICVPSAWCKQIFMANGIRRPILILSGCYDDDIIKPIPKTENKDEYVFLWQGVGLSKKGNRKGAGEVAQAFRELRKENRIGKDTRLIMKYRPDPTIEFTLDNVPSGDGIVYIMDNLQREDLLKLYSRVDCCINPTHGEGFGLIPLEQMAMGKCVLVTNWSMDYVKAWNCIPLQYKLAKSILNSDHHFFSVNLNGIAYNLTGETKEIRFLPRKRYKVPNGGSIKAYHPTDIIPPPKGWKRVKAYLWNALVSIQDALRLFPRPDRKTFTLFQEDPGLDAWVDLEYLKNQMERCYLNREDAEDIGFQAHQYVSREWGLFKMKESFNEIELQIMNPKQRKEP